TRSDRPRRAAGAGNRGPSARRNVARMPHCRKDGTVMQNIMHRAALAALFAVVSVLLVGSAARAQATRRTPFVEAAEKARPGIVSALGREIQMPSGATLKELIQTNASLNPGNSGGPLLNVNGELIGINVALREGAQGIAFALNADVVQKLLAQHLSAAKVAK